MSDEDQDGLCARLQEFDGDGNPTRFLDVDATGTTDISGALDQWLNEPYGDLNIGIRRDTEIGARNDYALFAEQFEHVHFISVDTAEFGRLEGVRFDAGTLDLGIIRGSHGWRALRYALIRPWRWWRIPMVLRYWHGPR